MNPLNEGAQAFLDWRNEVDEALKANKEPPLETLCPYQRGTPEGVEWVRGFCSTRGDYEI